MKQLWAGAGHTLFWLSWPLIWICVHGTTRTRVVIHDGDKVLLVKGWLSSSKWLLPGGGLRHTEEPPAGAAREVYEETGIRLKPEELTVVGQGWTRENGLSFRIAAYHAELAGSQKARPNRTEITDARWFPVDEALRDQPITATTRHLLEAWRDRG